jgi:hypothetical protein
MSCEESGKTTEAKRKKDAATSPILQVTTEKIPLLYQQWLKSRQDCIHIFRYSFFILYPCVKMFECEVFLDKGKVPSNVPSSL